MIRPLLLAASAALALSLAAPGDARAQQAAASAPAFVGLTPESVRDWLVAAGAEAGEVMREDGDVFFRVDDAGVVWFVFFYGCEADGRCGDLQFNTVFDGTGVSAATVAAWNRDQRWLKAFSTDADGQPVVFVQFDVLFVSGQGVGQLADATVLWLEGVDRFAAHLRAAAG
ncbi:MAG: YbjN domain-containing protein [Alphaproteobacteria bacterium]|nr:YbjN domain-containing protein [Alphaproteobacteria bacterium]MBU1526475.1 YbjN domain-containing protein [Alphaproteobacteria bacterium]MBU2116739.1 YbjN domain-containing protein [Alphaproteobacteria bacterium]MBU2350307.1 YbjN domain-containing protein [Alphaproteobacteria bacterium]MBU2382519.1 YbjN domain-containing protein [Alphaproteobacteria bacterium]